ncbi:MAG TPA: carboxypeptidase-like regulatory domain-containing protein [Saprospiraceae bacterium]|nr:carboxypeptidase-like regulatory domain-containing protein [Saprospiraceae bacterium]HMQ85137.1 carboxypeptidase-like regulatory domain-containing protein [Saprospiraceae bacterium]
MKQSITLLFITFFSFSALLGQNGGTIRGNVFDKDTGEPIIFGTIQLQGTTIGANTDFDGFFSIGNVPAGNYSLVVTYVGYDSVAVDIVVKNGGIVYQSLYMSPSSVKLETVTISGQKERARSDVQISKVVVTPKQIRSLPATGGEADIAQYLPVLPGIIVSGDQGGQLYIRGGSPVQNKILLDGMTIYNPFHSIGFFSVFETEAIRSVDVLTGGFSAEYGGRISAIVDIKTREGNKKRFGGLVSASPFQAKALFEGPLKKLEEGRGSTSFLLTAKHSYLNESSKLFYGYAVDTSFFSFAAGDTTFSDINKNDIGLPYTYTDLYGKLSFVGANGSKLNLFGFNFSDRFDFLGLVKLNWLTTGFGSNFTLIPPNSNVIIDGTVAFSDYTIQLEESDGSPRQSGINTYSALLNFSYFGNRSQINYGFEFTGFNTDFRFRNLVGLSFEQKDFTTELAGFFKYKYKVGNLIVEPSIRAHYYASQTEMSLEPRFGMKYNLSDKLRFKFAGGLYSQNLISTVNDFDVVNFFVGFLAGPEETIFQPGTKTPTDHRLQKSSHAIVGLEIDFGQHIEVNVEPYLKRFNQLININRNKLSELDPDFITETGDAYGIDFTFKYEKDQFYLWSTYSLGRVTRNDGTVEYPTIFDRRHNVNFLVSYAFGNNNTWEASLRWNYGSGFPFTQTQGFYEQNNFEDFLFTNILTGNFDLGVILSDEINGGRLSDYHRLDISLRKSFELSKNSKLEAVASVTNVYNRENIFFVDRITNSRVNQLPILPSVGLTFGF